MMSAVLESGGGSLVLPAESTMIPIDRYPIVDAVAATLGEATRQVEQVEQENQYYKSYYDS